MNNTSPKQDWVVAGDCKAEVMGTPDGEVRGCLHEKPAMAEVEQPHGKIKRSQFAPNTVQDLEPRCPPPIDVVEVRTFV
jgi:hypothetical protein